MRDANQPAKNPNTREHEKNLQPSGDFNSPVSTISKIAKIVRRISPILPASPKRAGLFPFPTFASRYFQPFQSVTLIRPWPTGLLQPAFLLLAVRSRIPFAWEVKFPAGVFSVPFPCIARVLALFGHPWLDKRPIHPFLFPVLQNKSGNARLAPFMSRSLTCLCHAVARPILIPRTAHAAGL
ncbi:MAG TPA: hypothetical protein VNZ25_05050, partial [Candidatus Angelobacter sp.]|nr:hypothetical protein [Candidatus Angelobacter sp.]